MGASAIGAPMLGDERYRFVGAHGPAIREPAAGERVAPFAVSEITGEAFIRVKPVLDLGLLEAGIDTVDGGGIKDGAGGLGGADFGLAYGPLRGRVERELVEGKRRCALPTGGLGLHGGLPLDVGSVDHHGARDHR